MGFEDYAYRQHYREALRDYLEQYRWEWFCSLNLAGHQSVSADSYIKKFTRGVGKRERIQVCCMGVKVLKPQLHVHLLMSGLDRYGHTLADKDVGRSERLWQTLTRGCAVIKYVRDAGASGYISFCNTPPEASELIEPYGVELLQKKRLIKANPALAPKKSSWHPYEYENLDRVVRYTQDDDHSEDEPEEIFEEPIL